MDRRRINNLFRLEIWGYNKGGRNITMKYSTIILEKAGGIATITLNRQEKLNAVNAQMLEEIIDAVGQVARDDTTRVLVLTGAGRVFCAGGDINWFNNVIEERKRGREIMDYSLFTGFCVALRNTLQPTIASINGAAIGAGITMTLNCDIRIAAEEAIISFPFTSMAGIIPELSSTYALPRLVGIAKACELVFTGKSITGKEAKEIGLVNDAVPLADLQRSTSELAETIAQASAPAVQLAKRGLYQGLNADVYSQLLWEEEGLRSTLKSEDHEEAVQAFLEKRKPEFKGKR